MSLDAHIALRRNSFEVDLPISVPSGTTVALLGPNGAGKSTAVAAIAGLVPLEDGHVVLGGWTLDRPGTREFVAPADRRIGVVFQDYLLFPHLSVMENVAFGLRSRGRSHHGAISSAEPWLERLGLTGLSDRRPGDLSGGEAQRVALARALITEPDLLLLDEPLAALDASTRVEMRRVLADHLGSFEGPRLLITHDPTEAFLLADQVFVIEAGVITQVGTADEIRLRPRTRYAADLAGGNLVEGTAADGVVTVGAHELHIADTAMAGPVLATIHPRAISLYRQRPDGSPRNTWQTSVGRIEHHGDRVRLQTGPPLVLTAEVTPGAVDALQLTVGTDVWVSIKAAEVGVEPD